MNGFAVDERARRASVAMAGAMAGETPAGPMRHVQPWSQHGAVPAARKSGVHRLALILVSLTIFSGFFVAFEPAPFDAMMIGLTVLLPCVGLVAITEANLVYLILWLLIVVFGFVASIVANDPATATPHIIITLYLSLGSFVLAAFVAKAPKAHGLRIFRASTAGALVAAITGICGYFDVFPGAKELFTVFDRATGSFKDPNVYAPFLVPPVIFLLHQALSNRLRGAILPVLGISVIGGALLLSFSRGAWSNLAVGLLVYGAITMLTARTNLLRFKLLAMVAVLAILGLGLVAAALESDSVGKLFDQRASVTQSYDEGPEGRFGGQQKAIGYVLAKPLGLGALQFGGILHSEQPHNVYISQFLNGGWIGGCLYIVLIVASLVLGLRAALKRRRETPLLPVALAAFAGLAVEGMVVETDHWRIFFVMTGVLWGLTFPALMLPRLSLPAMPLPATVAMLPMRHPRRGPRILGTASLKPQPIEVFRPKTRRREPTRRARIVVH